MNHDAEIMMIEHEFYRIVKDRIKAHVQSVHGGDEEALLDHEAEFCTEAGEVFRAVASALIFVCDH